MAVIRTGEQKTTSVGSAWQKTTSVGSSQCQLDRKQLPLGVHGYTIAMIVIHNHTSELHYVYVQKKQRGGPAVYSTTASSLYIQKSFLDNLLLENPRLSIYGAKVVKKP